MNKDKTKEVSNAVEEGLSKFLSSAGLIVESQAKLLAPVDTGNLRGSITHKVKDKEVIIGTNVVYAPINEYVYGNAFLRPAFDATKKDVQKLAKEILRSEIMRGLK